MTIGSYFLLVSVFWRAEQLQAVESHLGNTPQLGDVPAWKTLRHRPQLSHPGSTRQQGREESKKYSLHFSKGKLSNDRLKVQQLTEDLQEKTESEGGREIDLYNRIDEEMTM